MDLPRKAFGLQRCQLSRDNPCYKMTPLLGVFWFQVIYLSEGKKKSEAVVAYCHVLIAPGPLSRQ